MKGYKKIIRADKKRIAKDVQLYVSFEKEMCGLHDSGVKANIKFYSRLTVWEQCEDQLI